MELPNKKELESEKLTIKDPKAWTPVSKELKKGELDFMGTRVKTMQILRRNNGNALSREIVEKAMEHASTHTKQDLEQSRFNVVVRAIKSHWEHGAEFGKNYHGMGGH